MSNFKNLELNYKFEKTIEEFFTFKVGEEFNKKRLDLFLTRVNPEYSRSFYQKLIKEGYIFVNGNMINKPSFKLKKDNEVLVFIPVSEDLDIQPENIPLDILYEDKDIAVIYKPPNMVVHISIGHERGTLVNALLYHFKYLSEFGGKLRAGIVHRLDKDTAGLMVVAKTEFAHKELQKQFQNRTVNKKYKAIIVGIPEKEHSIINIPIGRSIYNRQKMGTIAVNPKEAITEYWLEKKWEKHNLSLVDIKLHTGRTHQIRVHFSSIGHPLVNDKVYGFRTNHLKTDLAKSLVKNWPYQCLIAYRLSFIHPRKNTLLDITLDKFPENFKELLNGLDT